MFEIILFVFFGWLYLYCSFIIEQRAEKEKMHERAIHEDRRITEKKVQKLHRKVGVFN